MANRATPATQQETLSPPWLLSAFDTNWNSPITALNDASLGYVNGMPVDTGVANAYAIALPFGAPTAYQDGMTIVWIPSATNTGSSTMTVSPLGAVAILTPAGNPLISSEITLNRPVTCVYKSAAPTGFRIVGPCPAIGNFSSGVNQTLECAGCTSVAVLFACTAVGLFVTLNHLAQGVPVTILFQNNSGSSGVFSINAIAVNGTAFPQVISVIAGGVGALSNIQTTIGSFTLGNGQSRLFSGQAVGNFLLLT